MIIDDYASSSSLFSITTNRSGTFRLGALTIQGGTGSLKEGGIITIGGYSSQVRIDHIHINDTTYTTEIAPKFLQVIHGVYGVLDHLKLEAKRQDVINFSLSALGGTENSGHQAFKNATDFGGPSFVFLEDSTYIGRETSGNYLGTLTDCDGGGKFVARYNTLIGAGGPSNHPTSGTSGRGCRAFEVYGNTSTAGPDFDPVADNPPAFFVWSSSGAIVVWGNSATAVNKEFIYLTVMRPSDQTYVQTPTPNGWGYCQGTLTTGTVNVASDGVSVTKTAGTNFNTSWVTDTMISITGASCSSRSADGTGPGPNTCRVSSVTDTSHLTLANSTGGALTGSTYTVGSSWDGNTDLTGYPCLDQPGRGQSELLSGSMPSIVNTERGNIIAWPNQALEPLREWSNTFTAVPGWGNNDDHHVSLGNGSSVLVENRDYYKETASFNGTVGVGVGVRASRPATCTTGVAYWSTDQGGNWHTTNGTANDGTLDVCTATNTWTNAVYTPYTYPHPLNR